MLGLLEINEEADGVRFAIGLPQRQRQGVQSGVKHHPIKSKLF
jgi:hypothetical protein